MKNPVQTGIKLGLGLILAVGMLLPGQAWGHQEASSQPITEAPTPEPTPSTEEPAAAQIDLQVEPPTELQPEPQTLTNPFNSPFSQQNFVPDISLILDLSGGVRNLSNENFEGLQSPLKLQGRPSGHGHSLNAHNGFNLNYAELTLQAPADPFFDVFATFHLSPAEFEIEEAYFNSRGLPGNFQVKAGKFLSHFGRINNQHAHFWNFNGLPLVYEDFLGGEALNEIGAQVSWLAPTDFFLNLGLEVLQGNNAESFGTAGFSVGDQQLKAVELPNLAVAYAKTSFDLSEELVLLGGLSYAQGGSRQTGSAESTADAHIHQALPTPVGAFAGGTRLLGADVTVRWLIDSYRELLWQSEFLHRSLTGSRYDATGRVPLVKEQSGLYSELVWRFDWQWRAGARLDLLTRNDQWENNAFQAGATWLPKYTAMLEFHPSEFSRLRLEYHYDLTRFANGTQTPVHAVFLNLNLAMGAHGAHNF